MEPAINPGELATELRSGGFRMGKPGGSHVPSPPPEHIGWSEGTWGSETSQYPPEEKTTCDSVSSGERKRKRPNRIRVIPGRGCVRGVVGPFLPVLPSWPGVKKSSSKSKGIEWPGVEGGTPVDVRRRLL